LKLKAGAAAKTWHLTTRTRNPIKMSSPGRCPVCLLPPGSDHRRCFFQGVQDGLWKSAGEWTEACRAIGPAAPAAPSPPAAAPPAPVPLSVITKQRLCGKCRKPGHDKRTCPGAEAAAAPAAAAPAPLTWKKLPGKKHTFPDGRYYLGDICYPLGDDPIYDEIWGKQFGYSEGIYQRSDGVVFAVFGTAYGDGEYRGVDGFKYSVDAGVIGLVPTSLFDEEKFKGKYRGDCTKPGGCGRIFKSSGEVDYTGGRVTEVTWPEGDERINTCGDEDDEEDDY
jgi:hypothetical protein